MSIFKSPLFSGFGLHQYTGKFLNLRIAVTLILLSFLIGTLGYIFIEGYSLLDAFYMVVITFSTVGYTEVNPLSDTGHLFTAFLIIINIGIFAYTLSAFTYYIVQGEFFKQLHLYHINRQVKELKDHVIVCGFGRYGKEITDHFLQHKVPFVLIDQDEQVIQEIQASEKHMLYIHGNATADEVLKEAGIKNAKSLISALPQDSSNLFIILSARQLNPQLTLISRAHDRITEKKLKLAGANHVIMPDQIGGFYMATLVNKPETVEFFSFLTNEFESDVGFDEISFEEMPEGCQNVSIADLGIRKQTGANIIGFKSPGGKYTINPGPRTILSPNSSFIILGDRSQLKRLRKYLEEY